MKINYKSFGRRIENFIESVEFSNHKGSIFSLLIMGFSIVFFSFSAGIRDLVNSKITALVVGITIIIMGEILFFLDTNKPKKSESKFWFTVKVKAVYLLISVFLVFIINGIKGSILLMLPIIKNNYSKIVEWMGYLGIGILTVAAIVGVLYGYFKLNSLKYGRK